jgi:hypothetical protein
MLHLKTMFRHLLCKKNAAPLHKCSLCHDLSPSVTHETLVLIISISSLRRQSAQKCPYCALIRTASDHFLGGFRGPRHVIIEVEAGRPLVAHFDGFVKPYSLWWQLFLPHGELSSLFPSQPTSRRSYRLPLIISQE